MNWNSSLAVLEAVSKPKSVVAAFARTWGIRRFAHVLANVATVLKLLLALLAATVMCTANAPAAEKFDADPKHQLSRSDGKPADHSKPVKVYVMLGQSNMLGFGRVGPSSPEKTPPHQQAVVTVHFDRLPTSLRFNAPAYPCLVTENDIQYSNGFAETYDPRLDRKEPVNMSLRKGEK